MKATRLVAAVLFLAALIAHPAIAEDHDASDPPSVSGPLVGVQYPCEDNGPAGPQEARAQSCSWSYDLIPAESNAGEDFSAYWFQMEIDPGRGWCAKMLTFKLNAPSDGRIVSASPDAGSRISKSRPAVNELLVDAEGAAPVPGRITQETILTRGRTQVEVDENHYSYVWRGNSRDKVVMAIGVQLAHGRTPPELFYTSSGGEGAGMGSCRPMRITSGKSGTKRLP